MFTSPPPSSVTLSQILRSNPVKNSTGPYPNNQKKEDPNPFAKNPQFLLFDMKSTFCPAEHLPRMSISTSFLTITTLQTNQR